jgi:tRNA(fMet)-specific endonuclease VapC
VALVLDTSVLVAVERRGQTVGTVLANRPGTPLVIAAITAAELFAGIEAADTDVRRRERTAFVDEVLRLLPVLPFDLAAAPTYAHLRRVLAQRGEPIGEHDLQIAAIALTHGHEVLTANPRHFGRVPGLVVHTVPSA